MTAGSGRKQCIDSFFWCDDHRPPQGIKMSAGGLANAEEKLILYTL